MADADSVEGAGDAAAGAAAAPAAGDGAPGAPSWTDGLDADLRGYVEHKGWDGPGALAKSYQSLEKLQRTPKERLLELPEDLADAEAMGSVYSRLGRPDAPDGYEFAGDQAEGVGVLEPKFREWAHEAGLSKQQAGLVFERYNAEATALQEAAAQAYSEAVQLQDQALQQKWGPSYEGRVALAKQAAKQLGLGGDLLEVLEGAMNLTMPDGQPAYQQLIETMAGVGEKIGEADFEGGDLSTDARFVSPEAAAHKLAEMRADKAFMDKVINNPGGAEQMALRKQTELANPPSKTPTAGGPPPGWDLP